MDKRVTTAGILLLALGLVFLLMYSIFFYAGANFGPYFFTLGLGIWLSLFGFVLFLAGLFRQNSISNLNKRRFCKGIILVAITIPVTYLIFSIANFIYSANGFGVTDTFWHNLGYSLMSYYGFLNLIEVSLFILGSYYILTSSRPQ
jgi:hypothetical protein